MAGANGNNTATTTDLMNQLLLSRAEVSELLRVPSSTIDNLHRTKQLQGVKVGKFLLWRPDAVRKFVEGLEPRE